MYHILGEEGGISFVWLSNHVFTSKISLISRLKILPFWFAVKIICRSETLYLQLFSASRLQDFSIPSYWFWRHRPQPAQWQRFLLLFGGGSFWLPPQELHAADGFCISCCLSPDPRGPSVSCFFCSRASGPGLGGLSGREGDLQRCGLYHLKSDTTVKFCKDLAVLSPRDSVELFKRQLCHCGSGGGIEGQFSPRFLFWGACLFLGVFLHQRLQKLRGKKTFLWFPICRLEGKLVQIHHRKLHYKSCCRNTEPRH